MSVPVARAQAVAERVGERGLDLLLVTDLINVRWLTGFTGSNGAAVVGRDGQLRFVTDFRYLTQSADRARRGLGARDRPRPAGRLRRRAARRASCASASTTPR